MTTGRQVKDYILTFLIVSDLLGSALCFVLLPVEEPLLDTAHDQCDISMLRGRCTDDTYSSILLNDLDVHLCRIIETSIACLANFSEECQFNYKYTDLVWDMHNLQNVYMCVGSSPPTPCYKTPSVPRMCVRKQTYHDYDIAEGPCSTKAIQKCNQYPTLSEVTHFLVPDVNIARGACGMMTYFVVNEGTSRDDRVLICVPDYPIVATYKITILPFRDYDNYTKCMFSLQTECTGITGHPFYNAYLSWASEYLVICLFFEQGIIDVISSCSNVLNSNAESRRVFETCLGEFPLQDYAYFRRKRETIPHDNTIANHDYCRKYYHAMSCLEEEVKAQCPEQDVYDHTVKLLREIYRTKVYSRTNGTFCPYQMDGDKCPVNTMAMECQYQEFGATDDNVTDVCTHINKSLDCLKNWKSLCYRNDFYAGMESDLMILTYEGACKETGECSTETVKKCTSLIDDVMEEKYLLPNKDTLKLCSISEEFDNCLGTLYLDCPYILAHPLIEKTNQWLEKQRITCGIHREAVNTHIHTCAEIINTSPDSWAAYQECRYIEDVVNSTLIGRGHDSAMEDERRFFLKRRKRSIQVIGPRNEVICSALYMMTDCFKREIEMKCPSNVTVPAMKWTDDFHEIEFNKRHKTFCFHTNLVWVGNDLFNDTNISWENEANLLNSGRISEITTPHFQADFNEEKLTEKKVDGDTENPDATGGARHTPSSAGKTSPTMIFRPDTILDQQGGLSVSTVPQPQSAILVLTTCVLIVNVY